MRKIKAIVKKNFKITKTHEQWENEVKHLYQMPDVKSVNFFKNFLKSLKLKRKK